MNEYEARRLENIKRNQALVQELGLEHSAAAPASNKPSNSSRQRPSKRRKLEPAAPTRSSARIAHAGARPLYNEGDATVTTDQPRHRSSSLAGRRNRTTSFRSPSPSTDVPASGARNVDAIRAGWTSWTPTAPPPARDDDDTQGTFHFASHPDFTPNKSPEEMLREGCFGGSYFRPLYSKALGTTIADDWRELPAEWTAGLDVGRYLTSPTYDPEVNKYGVSCGQSIEEWEAAGWIAHEYDVRGWFQWYCRFWMGRRCDDDERQIGRWRRCVGETGRWRRALLKKYVAVGIRSVFDDGDDDEARGDVSPVVHQTCHHWAYEVRQEALDRFWAEGR